MLFQSVVNRAHLGLSRKGTSPGHPLQSLLQGYRCLRRDEHISYGELGMQVPPFGCSFNTAADAPHILAVANEEGIVRLYDTECRNTEKQIVKEWVAHTNAVFDIAWVPGEHKLVTASGDQTAKLWDVKAGEAVGVCKGHQCSLKSVAFSKFETAVFSTGGRDGNIMVWDTRCNKKDGFYRQVNQISGAHNALEKQTPSKIKKKKPAVRGLAPSVDSQQSVTVVIFQDEHTLISAGAVDGFVKMWDLRKNYTAYRQDPIAVKVFPYPGNSTRKLGYSSLVLDSTGTNLFANCTDDNIYMFNATGLRTDPVSVFSGHQNSTFYIKSSVSPDGQFLLSGSSDSSAYIWQVSDPQAPPVTLTGHCQEVTSVTWCQSDFTKIATCSDDNTVRIWRLNRNSDDADKVDCVGWASQKRERLPVVSRLCTPGKNSVLHNSPLMSSPTPATCAPSHTGDLPMPSSTPSSTVLIPKLHTPKRQKLERSTSSPKQLSTSKISIKDWVSRTPKSRTPVPETKTPSPRKAFTPVEQYSVTSSSRPSGLSEKRVKRRLETSNGDEEHGCFSLCSCVTELEPGLKKPKLDLCSLQGTDESDIGCVSLGDLGKCDHKSTSESKSIPHAEPMEQPSLQSVPADPKFRLQDKENSSPEKNWLSVLGHKLKTDKLSPQGKLSSSPSARGGSAKKHHVRSITNSPVSVSTTPVSMRKICTYFIKSPGGKSEEE
ncbi:denticleless protein homolog [Spea bombifrons]|uniref:denticleless protein homolog n=1 Tax=Spea bombifrons TaxID=233779 RepID=UPI00234A21A9|nr:denticleless protein homolog [Spea bombifrons]